VSTSVIVSTRPTRTALVDLPTLPGVASVVAKTAEELAAGAVLIRPDGYLCWTALPGPLTAADLTLLHAAADRWCPRPC
jgi:hypothetical protein